MPPAEINRYEGLWFSKPESRVLNPGQVTTLQVDPSYFLTVHCFPDDSATRVEETGVTGMLLSHEYRTKRILKNGEIFTSEEFNMFGGLLVNKVVITHKSGQEPIK